MAKFMIMTVSPPRQDDFCNSCHTLQMYRVVVLFSGTCKVKGQPCFNWCTPCTAPRVVPDNISFNAAISACEKCHLAPDHIEFWK